MHAIFAYQRVQLQTHGKKRLYLSEKSAFASLCIAANINPYSASKRRVLELKPRIPSPFFTWVYERRIYIPHQMDKTE